MGVSGLSWDTWKTGCILLSAGNSSLYAILPIFSITEKGPKYLYASLAQGLFATDDYA